MLLYIAANSKTDNNAIVVKERGERTPHLASRLVCWRVALNIQTPLASLAKVSLGSIHGESKSEAPLPGTFHYCCQFSTSPRHHTKQRSHRAYSQMCHRDGG